MIPDDDEAHRDHKNQSGDGVDFRRDAAAEAAPDFKGQRVVASDEKESDGDFVHREREDEQAGGDERESKVGQSDSPKRLPGSSAEIERGFLLHPVQLLQAGEEFRGCDGNQRGAVTEKDCQQAKLRFHKNGEHQKRKAGDDARENQREEHEAAEETFAGEVGAVEGERGEQPKGQRERDTGCSHDQAIQDGIPDGGVSEELRVPIQREVARRKAADAIAIEGIEDQHDDGQINESEDQRSIDGEKRRAAGCESRFHLKAQRFSRTSLRKSKEMVITRMPTEIAAPSGQSNAVPNRLCTTFAIMVPEGPPTRRGARKSPSDRTNANVAPASRPGIESGRMTRRNV